MIRLQHLCLGVCAASLLVVGLLWMPNVAAAQGNGDSHDGPSRPSESSYGNNGQNGQYGGPQEGKQQYGNEQQYGREQNGDPRHDESPCQALHKIALGENLTLIAASYGVSVDTLAEANGIEDANLIVENQALCVPHAEGSSEANGEGHEPYREPGVGYDPSALNREGNGYGEEENGYGEEENGYHDEENGYYDEKNGYGPQQKSYGPQENGYGPQENGCGEQGSSWKKPYMRPGVGYDPSLYEDQEKWQKENSYNQQGGCGPEQERGPVFDEPEQTFDPSGGPDEPDGPDNPNGNGTDG